MTVLVSVLTLLFPAVMIPFNCILYVKDSKKGTLYSALIALGLAAIAFNINPPSGQNTDIVRHFANLELVKDMSLTQAIASDTFESLIGYYVLLKVISLTGIRGLLPASVTFIGYFICLYLIHKFDLVKDSYTRFIALFLFISAISFLGFCTGIRQYLVYSVMAIFFYFELVKKKFRLGSWIIYFLLVTIHTSVILVILLRIIASIFMRGNNYRFVFIVFAWSLIQNTVVAILANNFGGNVYVDRFVEMVGHYSENGSSFIMLTYFYRVILTIFCSIISYSLLKNATEEQSFLKKYLVLTLVICVFSLGGFTSYDILARFSALSGILAIPLIPLYFKGLSVKTSNLFRLGIPFFTALVFVYNLTQYATITFNSFSEICLTNIFTFLGV